MLAVLLAMAGGGDARMARHQRTAVWGLLRPAESALRRLIVVVKHVWGIEARVSPRAVRGAVLAGAIPRGTGQRLPVFGLFDRRKCFALRTGPKFTRGNPRVWSPGMDYPVFVEKILASPDDMVSVERLHRRIMALQSALGDLPKQARRLARWECKRALGRQETGKFIRPMRPGKPPGHRTRQLRPVDHVLSDCHALALYLLNESDARAPP